MPNSRSYSLTELVNASGFDRRTIVYYIQSGLLPKVGRRGPHTRYPEECLTRLLFIRGVRRLQAEGQLLTATLAEIRRGLAARDHAGIQALLERGLPVREVADLFAAEALTEPVAATPVLEPAAGPPPPLAPARVSGPAGTGPTGERRSYGLADAGIRRSLGADRPAEPGAGIGPPVAASLPVPPPAEGRAPVSEPLSAAAPSPSIPPGEDVDLGELLRELELRPTLNARRNPPGSPEQWTEIPITSRIYLSIRGLSAEDSPLAESVARQLKRALRGRGAATGPEQR